ncbi:S8 family serine peptidase [Ferrimonas marina]|uniref:PA domain-containing protein n=1 Tax=Ferrimonas marina TaxID=299255 RepID=A0A1M5Y314_9GAMM|nr:S8 family serine peptidase [Ferrimonas marina]SHI06329.1 PA domain-containing protein [Ferrimonas marina]
MNFQLDESGQPGSQTISVDAFDMTAEQYAEMKAHQQQLLNREGITSAPNQHIGRAGKVPFQYESGLQGEHTYIIQLDDAPLATYQGGVAGLNATAATSQPSLFGLTPKLNLNSSASLEYLQYLDQRQASIHSTITGKLRAHQPIKNSFKFAFNGMSMELTQQQAAQVAKLSGVRAVTRSTVLQLQTDVGPEHIGADHIWDGSATDNGQFTGAGIVVGILDTGINSDHPSFTAMGDDGVAIVNPLGSGNYLGDCEQEAHAHLCNDKLIGVRSYPIITDTYGDPVFRDLGWWADWERARPANGEDYNGHGSHTASTVAGNILYDVPYQMSEPGYGDAITGRDTDLVFPRVSGVAPHANIISYQVCWAGGQGDPYAGCPEEATLMAVEDAIRDGVDVINFSVGGAERSPWASPTELAFLAAREAGISVAASAGNAGYYWMDHVSPWLTSVAATTHSRILDSGDKRVEGFEGGDSNPSSYGMSAAGLTGAYTGPVVSAADYGDGNCDTEFAMDTFSQLPDGTPLAEAPIVVCGRSDQPRVFKADNVKAGGAGAMILYNTQSDYLYGDSLVQKVEDFYSLPSAHIGNYDGGKIIDWLASGTDHRATITDGSLFTTTRPADQLATFSSRGPSTTTPNVMAPTLAAPGVDVFAAYANDRIFTMDGFGMNWAMISGTSMASPHVAGAMALLKNAHPTWTPAEIQSALTTTASKVAVQGDEYGNTAPVSFDDAGAGVINVDRAAMATLVQDESVDNYRAANPHSGGDVRHLNTPYLVDRECQGSCSWFRTFTATESGSWTVSSEEVDYTGASLMSLEFTPAYFSLEAGESQRVMVTATLPDVDYQSDSPLGPGNTDGLTFFSKLKLTPSDSSKPVQTLPVIAAYDRAALPTIVQADVGRDEGSLLTAEVVLPPTPSLEAQVYGMATGEQKEYALQMNTVFPQEIVAALPSAESQIGYRMFTVPTGTKRLVVEIAEEDDLARFGSRIDLGRDVNGDGKIHWEEEAICVSDWRLADYCAINDPEPGVYWYMVSNIKGSIGWWDPYDEAHRIVTNVTIIDDVVTDRLSVSATDSDGIAPQQLELNWDINGIGEGEILHALVELGTDATNPSDIGKLPVRLQRSEADVQFSASHEGARVGDIVEFEVIQQANLLGDQRDIHLSVELPAGLSLIEESVRGNEFANPRLSVAGSTVTLQGTQPSTKDVPRTYEYSTNLDDPQCRLPFSDHPEFVDLPGIGVPQLPAFSNEWDQMYEIPDFVGYDNYFPHIPLYGVEAKDTTNILTVQGDGMLRFDAHAQFSLPGYTLANDGVRDLVVAPFWRANAVSLNESGMDFATFTPYEYGVYAASLNQGAYFAAQWKRMYNAEAGMLGMEVDKSTYFDFMTLASSVIDFTPGVYELFFAYGEMDSELGEHTVGLKGYQGVRGFYYPVNGYHYDDYAVNQPEKLGSNLLVCANYQGPESTRAVMRFAALVTPEAASSSLPVVLTAEADGGNTVTEVQVIDVNSNIVVYGIADQTIDENDAIAHLAVDYLHSDNRAVGLMVSADNVMVEVDGMSFSLTPEANWNGMTEVTATVYDLANPSDQASTRFMLTVNAVDSEPVIQLSGTSYAINAGETLMLDASQSVDPDGGELSFEWEHTTGPSGHMSGAMGATPVITDLGIGYHEFTVTVSNATHSVSEVVTVMVNGAPQVDIAPESITVAEGSTITISAAGTTDPDGDALSFYWEVVSGFATLQNANTSMVTLKGLSAGEVVLEVRVSDGMTVSTKQAIITVVEPGEAEPESDEGSDGSNAQSPAAPVEGEEEGDTSSPEQDTDNSNDTDNSGSSNSGNGSSNANAAPEAAEQGASGGSLGYLVLMLLALTGLRRRS